MFLHIKVIITKHTKQYNSLSIPPTDQIRHTLDRFSLFWDIYISDCSVIDQLMSSLDIARFNSKFVLEAGVQFCPECQM